MTIILPEDFLIEFNQPKNVAEQAIVSALIQGIERLVGTGLTEARRKELVHEIVRNEDSRFFHILETQMVEHMVKPRFRARPMFIEDEDLAFAQIGLADLPNGSKPAELIKGKRECQDFLQKIVEKLWHQIEKDLKPFSHRSIVAACFRAIDEINRDSAHWRMTTRSVLALQQELKQTKAVLAARSSQRSVASLANRILIETAQYSAGGEGGRQLNRADHGQLLARVELLITMAHHHDAIAYGFLKPEVRVNLRGDIEVDESFYKNVMRNYFSHRSDKSADQAVDLYDSYFDRSKRSEGAAPEKDVIEFDEAFQGEFGFGVRQLFQINELWRKFAIESGALTGVLDEEQMLGLLEKFAEMNCEQSQHFLSRFTLPIRSGWDADLPPRCSRQDVFPWRFRRNLSVLMRPLVQVGTNPSRWMVSAPLFENAGKYLTGNIYEGRLPDRFFWSQKLRSYIGEVVHKHGHAFAERSQTSSEKGITKRKRKSK